MAARMLEGIRIVDQSGVVFGPYATQVLADLGAEVIKVEPKSGDTFRRAGKPARTPTMGACHMTLNRGKRSIALDLTQEDDREVLRRLITGTDVYLTNVRGKAIEKLGFGYDRVRALKDDIIYIHCVGFGSDGPYAGLQAYDDVIQAATGAASLASLVDGDPRPRYIPSLIADKIAGLHAAYAVMAAVIHRLRTGEGQFIEVPMFESFAHFMLLEHLFEATFDPPTGGLGYTRQLDPFRQPFPTADGYISIVPYTDPALLPLFTLLGAPEILGEERFATPQLRFRNVSELHRQIGLLTPAKTTAEWVALLREASIPAMPVRALADMLDDPHLAATGFFKTRAHPTEGGYREMQPPVKFGAAAAFAPRPAPHLDQDGAAIRRGTGAGGAMTCWATCPSNTPVIVGVGEAIDRPADLALARHPVELMANAVRVAERDAGAGLIDRLDAVEAILQISWPYPDAGAALADELGIGATRVRYGAHGGHSPMRAIHDAALRIQRGEA